MDWIIASVAERKIREAIEEGKFDNLPGKGKPLNLDDDPMTPPHLRVANRILKNAGVLPDWMQVDVEIDRMREENDRMWARIEREYPRRRARAECRPPSGVDPERQRRDFAAWHVRQRQAYLAAIRRVNSDITKLNLIAPSVPRVHVPYRIQEETARFDAAFPPLPGYEPTSAQPGAAERTAAGASRASTLRLAASAEYGGARQAAAESAGDDAKVAPLSGAREQGRG